MIVLDSPGGADEKFIKFLDIQTKYESDGVYQIAVTVDTKESRHLNFLTYSNEKLKVISSETTVGRPIFCANKWHFLQIGDGQLNLMSFDYLTKEKQTLKQICNGDGLFKTTDFINNTIGKHFSQEIGSADDLFILITFKELEEKTHGWEVRQVKSLDTVISKGSKFEHQTMDYKFLNGVYTFSDFHEKETLMVISD